ncbi:MAG: Ca2+-binding RTX toxin-like protein [Porticoccaceae bacterium]
MPGKLKVRTFNLHCHQPPFSRQHQLSKCAKLELRNGGAILELRGSDSLQIVDGVVKYRDGVGDNQDVTVSSDDMTGEIVVRVDSSDGPSDEVRIASGSVAGIDLNLGAGDDRVTILTSDLAVTISGGSGSDKIEWHGSDASDHLTVAQSAGDLVTVSAMLEGDMIREIALFDGVEHFGMELQGGDDSVLIEAFAEPSSLESVHAVLGAGNDRFDSALADFAVNVSGNAGDDTVVTGSGNDILNGGSGDDSLDAGAGNDALLGGNGDDLLLGGDGNDRLRGHGGIDTLDGAEGVDMLDGGRHRTHLRDQISGRVALTNDGYSTENGDQVMSGGGFASVSLLGSDGNDEFDSSAFTTGEVTLDGGGGDDEIIGDGSHTMDGGDGRNRIVVTGTEFRDRVAAGSDDRVTFVDSGHSVDLTQSNGLGQAEVIDISGNGPNLLKLRRESLGPGPTIGFRHVEVIRDSDDELDIGDGWKLYDSQSRIFLGEPGVPREFVTLRNDGVLLSIDTFSFPELIDGTLVFRDDIGVSHDITLSYDTARDEVVVDLLPGAPPIDNPVSIEQRLIRFRFTDVSTVEIELGNASDRLTVRAGLPVPVSVNGGGGTDTIRLIGTEDVESFTWSNDDDGELILRQSSEVTGKSMILHAPGIEHVEIDARGGDDRVLAEAGSTTPVSVTRAMINLGAGNDLFQLLDYGFAMNVNGAAGNDEIITGSADDTLVGGGGNDHLVGGLGNDRIRGQGGVDLIAGGKGIDTLDGGGGVTDLFDDIDGRVELTDSGYETVNGDTARSGGGFRNVFLRGGDGDDVLSASQFTGRNVTLAGGAGNDVLLGSRNDDVLLGEGGNDSLLGAMGDDLMHGGDGDDRLRGHGGHDLLVGGIGNDFLDGATGHDRLDGEEGDDTLIGMNGEDTLSGGTGDDSLDGGGGATTLREEANVDMVLATREGQTVLDGLGVDTIVGRVTAAILIGGDTANRLDASGFAGQVALYGGMGNDTLIGTRGNDTIDGGAARDSIEAGAGDDIVLGGFGNDHVFGGVGSDTLLGGKGNDVLNGAGGSDVVLGEKGDDTVHGGDATDQVAGGGNGFAPAAGDVISDASVEIDETLTFDASGLDRAAGI